MAASNVVQEQRGDHASRMVDFALEACTANHTLIDDTDPSQKEVFVCLQAGLHTGSVTAGVIGKRNARFSLMGENVQIAALMAKRSKFGMVNCSQEAAEVIEQQQQVNGSAHQIKIRSDTTFFNRFGGRTECFWVSRKDKARVDALERVRAAQRLRVLESALERQSGNGEGAEDEGVSGKGIDETNDGDMDGLEGSLHSRLSRNLRNSDIVVDDFA